jgi:hypothetical protein
MEVFTLLVFGGLVLALVALIVLGASSSLSIGQLTGRADEKRLASQATLEEHDVDEMVDSHNQLRRRMGKAEVSEAEVRARADASQRQSIDQAKRHADESAP